MLAPVILHHASKLPVSLPVFQASTWMAPSTSRSLTSAFRAPPSLPSPHFAQPFEIPLNHVPAPTAARPAFQKWADLFTPPLRALCDFLSMSGWRQSLYMALKSLPLVTLALLPYGLPLSHLVLDTAIWNLCAAWNALPWGVLLTLPLFPPNSIQISPHQRGLLCPLSINTF